VVAKLITLGGMTWLPEPSTLSCQTQGAKMVEKKQ